jgi:hypothetical protein
MTVPALTNAQQTGQERGVVKGTRYHSTGGPTEGKAYRVAVQANANFRSESVRNREFLSNISLANVAKLPALANIIPAHQCQKYVVCMLALMEKRGMIPHGIAHRLAARVQMGRAAAAYEGQHPVPDPVGIALPPSWPRPDAGPSRVASSSPPRPPVSRPSPAAAAAAAATTQKKERDGCCVLM